MPIHRANHSLRAVRVPQGHHQVRFDDQPGSFRVGLTHSLLGGLGLAAWGLRLGRRRGATAR
ncbi:hypothetical protein ACLEPN_13665 [Myxococcus sp. 1LA]